MKLDNPQNINSKAVVLPDGNTYQVIKGEVYQVQDEFSLGELGFKKAFKKLRKLAGKKLLSKFGGKFGISPWAVGAGVAAAGMLSRKKKKKKRRGAAQVAPQAAAYNFAQNQTPLNAAPSPIERVDNSMPMMEQKPPVNWLLLGGIGLVGFVLLSNRR